MRNRAVWKQGNMSPTFGTQRNAAPMVEDEQPQHLLVPIRYIEIGSVDLCDDPRKQAGDFQKSGRNNRMFKPLGDLLISVVQRIDIRRNAVVRWYQDNVPGNSWKLYVPILGRYQGKSRCFGVFWAGPIHILRGVCRFLTSKISQPVIGFAPFFFGKNPAVLL